MSDEEIVNAVHDALLRDGRVTLDEVAITAGNGKVTLEGKLPSLKERQILLTILQDVMGLQRIVDHLEIDRLAGMRGGQGRLSRTKTRHRAGESDIMADTHASKEEGTAMIPPDELIPEKEK